jgi:hypothetical protein
VNVLHRINDSQALSATAMAQRSIVAMIQSA